MHELPVTALAAVNPLEPGSFEIGDQLADLARHMRENATPLSPVPAPIPPVAQRECVSGVGDEVRQGFTANHAPTVAWLTAPARRSSATNEEIVAGYRAPHPIETAFRDMENSHLGGEAPQRARWLADVADVRGRYPGRTV